MEALHGGGAALSAASAWVEKANVGVVLSCGVKTDLRVSSTRGVHLASIDTGGLTNHGAALSPDGRFIAAATFTVDVKCDPLSSHAQLCPFQDCEMATLSSGAESSLSTAYVFALKYVTSNMKCP